LIAILAGIAGGLGLLVHATPAHVGVVAESTHDCGACFHDRK
jgi:hypothetical protein